MGAASLTLVEPVDTLLALQDSRQSRACPPKSTPHSRWGPVVEAAFNETSFAIHCQLVNAVGMVLYQDSLNQLLDTSTQQLIPISILVEQHQDQMQQEQHMSHYARSLGVR